jgi:hypothetical protein
VPLREHLPGHTVHTASERGWPTLKNGELLSEAECDLLVTTDRSLHFRQNLSGRRLAIVVPPAPSRLKLREAASRIAEFAGSVRQGAIKEFSL